jgi:hypothetical protein
MHVHTPILYVQVIAFFVFFILVVTFTLFPMIVSCVLDNFCHAGFPPLPPFGTFPPREHRRARARCNLGTLHCAAESRRAPLLPCILARAVFSLKHDHVLS